MKNPAILALADGTVFTGTAIGYSAQTCGELVFNTAMTGYQEILTDPSYARQIVTFTYPHIGNVGTNREDAEAKQPWVAGLVVRDLSRMTSSWRSEQSLSRFLQQHQITGIADIDTRHLTHILRDQGAQNGCISHRIDDVEAAITAARTTPSLVGADLAQEVCTTEIYQLGAADAKYHIVAYDYGVKQNILNLLLQQPCRITVVPAKTSAEDVLAMNPDGIFLSNGPGDPAACDYAIAAIRVFLTHDIPLFGICLGHQLLALACGARTIKMKFGHHGANHPVEDIGNERVWITSQNHGFTVDEASLPEDLQITHRSLFDKSIQGIRHTHLPAFAFQGHPEASPGPHDAQDLFSQFIELIKQVHHA